MTTGLRGCGDVVDPNVDNTGAGYVAPELAVSCAGGVMTIQSNGMIPYEWVTASPRGETISPNNQTFSLPIDPIYEDDTTEVPCLDNIAIAINGIVIYGANEGPQPDPFGDPWPQAPLSLPIQPSGTPEDRTTITTMHCTPSKMPCTPIGKKMRHHRCSALPTTVFPSTGIKDVRTRHVQRS